MICDECLKEWDGRPWVMADITTGSVHAYCEACVIVKIDDYIAAKKKLTQAARNN